MDLASDFNNFQKLLVHNSVNVGTSQVQVKAGATISPGIEEVFLYNDGSSIVYLGLTGVSASGATKGIPLTAKGGNIKIDVTKAGELYLISTTATNSVLVFEFGVP